MTNKLIRKIEFDDGGPSMEDMGFYLSDDKNSFCERGEYGEELILLRDNTGRWNYHQEKISTTNLLYKLENQKWKLKI